MAEIKAKLVVQFSAQFTFDEEECRALDALIGYGDEAFIEVFYKHLGAHYLKPHEAGLRRVFHTLRKDIKPALVQCQELRNSIK